jgi:hypothetical protein
MFFVQITKMFSMYYHTLSSLEYCIYESRDSVFGIEIGYGLDDQGVGVPVPVEARIFSLLHVVQTGSGVQPTSYLMGTSVSFSRGKAAGA